MAVKDNDQTGQPTRMGQAMSGAQQQQNRQNQGQPTGGQQYQQPNQGQPQPARRNFSSIGQQVKKAMPLTGAGEALARTQKVMQEVIDDLKDGTQAVNATLIPIEHNLAGVRLPVAYLVVAAQMAGNENAGVGYRAMIIEASVDGVTAGEDFVGNVKYPVLRTVADADTPEVKAMVHAYVCDRFQTSKAYGAIAMVLPRTFKLDDPLAVKNLTSKVSFDAAIELQRNLGMEPLNLVDFIGGDEVLKTQLTFDTKTELNLVGQPVRSDTKIDLMSEQAKKGDQTGMGTVPATNLAHTDCFIDFVYMPKVPQQNMYGAQAAYGQVNPDVWRKFLARCVFTSMKSESLTTLDGQLLALASALGIRNGNAWMQTFKPNRHLANEVDYRDIGALNIEANLGGNPAELGKPMDTKADTFTDGSMVQYLASITHEGLAFSIDVSERGPDTCYNGALAAADDGDPEAIRAVIQAVNNLTNGYFNNHFPSGAAITLQMGETVLCGQYRNKAAEMCDIREIDTLALYNLYGENRKDVVDDYSDSILKTEFQEVQRLAGREQLLRSVTTNVVFTGKARRVTFTKEFIDAFTKAVEETRIAMPVVAPYLDTAGSQRAVGNFGQAIVSGQSAMYNRFNNAASPSHPGGGNRFASKWNV